MKRDAEDLNRIAPHARKVLVKGNHCDNPKGPGRLPEKIRDAVETCKRMILEDVTKGWEIIEYSHRANYFLGPVVFRHGAEIGVYADEDQAIQYGVTNNLVIGAHTHKLKQITEVIYKNKIPMRIWCANVGTGADFEKMQYVNRLNIARWGRGLIIGDCNASERKRAFMTRQWDAELLIHSTAH